MAGPGAEECILGVVEGVEDLLLSPVERKKCPGLGQVYSQEQEQTPVSRADC